MAVCGDGPADQCGWGGGDYAAGRDRRLTGRGFTGCTGNGVQLAMDRAQARAFSLSLMPGNRRRNSTAADNSPPCSNAVRIAVASASETQNIV
jgi:hypothetical protein